MTDNIILAPGPRSGETTIPSSKSQAHRLMICAALTLLNKKQGQGPKKIALHCSGFSKDIEATMDCLRETGLDIEAVNNTITMTVPINAPDLAPTNLHCKESGSTLRFLLPVEGALGKDAVFHMEGRLPERPMGPLCDVLEQHGMNIHQEGDKLHFNGQLVGGEFVIPGNISSQYISGLLMALPILEEDSILLVTGKIESTDYILMTEDALRTSGIKIDKRHTVNNELEYIIKGKQHFNIPSELTVEPDWSSAAFFLSLGALSNEGVTLWGMNLDSAQGDKRILNVLKEFGADIDIVEKSSETKNAMSKIAVKRNQLKAINLNASLIPDLVPVIATIASGAEGITRIHGAERLRIKESDRLATTCDMLTRLGATLEITEDGLLITGKPKLNGGKVVSHNDHRIAMSAAVAASLCEAEVEVHGTDCVKKSFLDFWEKFTTLDLNNN